MIERIFDWVIAPAGLLVAFAIVEAHLEGRTHVMLASFLSGCTLGLYFGLLLLKRRKSG
jgi:hypothetical protein